MVLFKTFFKIRLDYTRLDFNQDCRVCGLTYAAENLRATTDSTNLFHRHEKSMEDQVLSVKDTTAHQCNTEEDVPYLLDRRGQIQRGH